MARTSKLHSTAIKKFRCVSVCVCVSVGYNICLIYPIAVKSLRYLASPSRRWSCSHITPRHAFKIQIKYFRMKLKSYNWLNNPRPEEKERDRQREREIVTEKERDGRRVLVVGGVEILRGKSKRQWKQQELKMWQICVHTTKTILI